MKSKPIKPKISKPRLPAKPKKPVLFGEAIELGELYEQGLDWTRDQLAKLEPAGPELIIECEDGNLALASDTEVIVFYPKLGNYESLKKDYDKRVADWEKRYAPEIAAYEAAQLQFEIDLLTLKKEIVEEQISNMKKSSSKL